MRLWTIQDERVMESISKYGVYTVDPKNTAPIYFKNEDGSPDKEFRICYGWMKNQLDKTTPKPEATRYPIWAWKQYSDKMDKPDMRSWTTTIPEKVVRLTLEVPDDEVLVSDFDLWHIPLNLGYCAYSKKEDDEFDAWCTAQGIDQFHKDIWDFDKQDKFLIEARRKIFKSWERVFDLDATHWEKDWAGPVGEFSLQAVFWQLKEEYIRKVEFFTTRKAGKSK